MHGNRLPRGVRESLALEGFKKNVDVVLRFSEQYWWWVDG